MIEMIIADNYKVRYFTADQFVRRYTFEYTSYNGFKNEIKYDVYITTINFKDQFKVKGFMKDDKYFDTFNEAVAYIFKDFNDLKECLEREEAEIITHLATKTVRRGRPKKGLE